MPSDIKRARFERELLPHLDAAHNLARWLLKSSDEAQDVTQEAFLRALKYFDSFRGENARAWVLKIVRNSCYSWIKNRPKLESMTEDDEGNLNPEHECALEAAGHGLPGPDARIIEQTDRQLLNDCLRALPAPYREILILREIEQLSYRDISEVTAIPMGTVMSRLSRARTLLRQRLWSSDLAAEVNQ